MKAIIVNRKAIFVTKIVGSIAIVHDTCIDKLHFTCDKMHLTYVQSGKLNVYKLEVALNM